MDRGLHSKQVVELMIQLQEDGAVCLRGNHDDVLDWLCNMKSETDLRTKMGGMEPDLLSVSSWWLMNGLFPTIKSYSTVTENVPLDILITIFTSSVPRSHKEFFRGLKLFWENDTHFACHAYLDPTKELPRTLTFLSTSCTMDLLWSRFSVKRSQILHGHPMPAGVACCKPVWDRVGVFGHTPVSFYGAVAPIKHGNLRLIDTGAFQNGYLCAYIVEQDCWLLQATDSRDISS